VKNWDNMGPEERHQVTVLKGGKPTTIKPERVSYVIEQVAYWRKANAIHQWFVEHVQNGEDDCKPYVCDSDKLKELLSAVDAVLKCRKKAKELLPTQEGFFFGSIEYDEYYRQYLKDTKRMLEEILAEPDADISEYVYQSSW